MGEVRSVRAVKRIPEEERWSEDCVRWVRGTLWHKYRGDPEKDGEIPDGKAVEVEEGGGRNEEKETGEGGGVTVKMREVRPREFQIRKENAERLGYTRGCAGCTSWFKGGARQAHSDRCRNRFREEMKEQLKVKRAQGQMEEYERKVENKRGKKEEHKKQRKVRHGNDPPEEGREEDQEAAQSKDSDLEREVERPAKRGMFEAEGEGDEVEGGGALRDAKKQKTDEEASEVEEEESGRSSKKQRIEQISNWIQQVKTRIYEEEDEDEEEWREAWDDVRGGSLKYNEVVEARREEIEYMVKRGIWELKPIAECWERTGKGPTGVRWVDTNKGSEAESDVRCRLVARDFRQKKDKGREDLFAETPPLEQGGDEEDEREQAGVSEYSVY